MCLKESRRCDNQHACASSSKEIMVLIGGGYIDNVLARTPARKLPEWSKFGPFLTWGRADMDAKVCDGCKTMLIPRFIGGAIRVQIERCWTSLWPVDGMVEREKMRGNLDWEDCNRLWESKSTKDLENAFTSISTVIPRGSWYWTAGTDWLVGREGRERKLDHASLAWRRDSQRASWAVSWSRSWLSGIVNTTDEILVMEHSQTVRTWSSWKPLTVGRQTNTSTNMDKEYCILIPTTIPHPIVLGILIPETLLRTEAY